MKRSIVILLACAAAVSSRGQVGNQGGFKPAAQPPGAVTPPVGGALTVPVVQAPGQEKKVRPTANGLLGANYAVASSYRTGSSSEAIPPLVIQFSSTNQSLVSDWEEDLTVMTHIIEEALQRAADEDLADYKMGIPMLVTPNRSVRPMYLEGFGAIFMIKVNFPVVAPSANDAQKPERTESEWEKARGELYGPRRQTSWMPGNVESGAEYDPDQVDTLKKELIDALRNVSNFRNLKPDEYVSVTVFGSSNTTPKSAKSSRKKKADAVDAAGKEPATVRVRVSKPGPGTVLTLRVKKSDVDGFANGTIDMAGFEKKIAMNSYLGNGYGITSLNSWTIRNAIQDMPLGR